MLQGNASVYRHVQSLAISLPYTRTRGRLTIYDGNGRLISVSSVSNTAVVQLAASIIRPGLYFYRIVDQGSGASFKGKFVFENER